MQPQRPEAECPSDTLHRQQYSDHSMERRNVTSGLLYTWRRQTMSGELAGTPRPALPGSVVDATPCFAEIQMADQAPQAPPAVITPAACAEVPGRIGIEPLSGVLGDRRYDADWFKDALQAKGHAN